MKSKKKGKEWKWKKQNKERKKIMSIKKAKK